jgi:hypothetical protein
VIHVNVQEVVAELVAAIDVGELDDVLHDVLAVIRIGFPERRAVPVSERVILELSESG